MATTLATLAVPGQHLGPVTSYSAGAGTHVQNANIYASITGPVAVDPAPPNTKSKSTLSVSRNIHRHPALANRSGPAFTTAQSSAKPTPPLAPPAKPKQKYNTLPSVDSIVLARVTRVQKRQATVSILVVLDNTSPTPPAGSTTASDNDNITSILTSSPNPENHSSSDELRFQALIRKEDVRAVEKDRVVMDEMFRVGDIIRGSVISLGDQSFYYLTTARNDLGVVLARSAAGNMMFPASWKEMRDPVSGEGETRKVARPF
ncbi:Exosome complex subunit Csl4 [Aspergillus sp. HF37]|nr:Exosome complex subunit Csl4 [Aspergillus sp. HF37]